MKEFISPVFMLFSPEAEELYHNHAEHLPIIDYHCHLSPKMIAEDVNFSDITQLWIVDHTAGDHYKWRAMRGNGIDERYITGEDTTPWEKFMKWAETMPYLMRNPLYHWSHMELKRVFGIDTILKPETAREIFDECNHLLRKPEYSTMNLLKKFNVQTLCTTDDPADDLRFHAQIRKTKCTTEVLPAWRPDKAMAVDASGYGEYIEKLGHLAGMEIRCYDDLQAALESRHRFFAEEGCCLSDHGLDTFHSASSTPSEIDRIFKKGLLGHKLTAEERDAFMSRFLYDQAVMDAEAGWVQQYHVGPLRNCSTRMFRSIGADTGFDSIGDLPVSEAGHRFFDLLDSSRRLAKTILYCLNPKDYEVMCAMAYTFNDGTAAGKMQVGSAWWFLDHESGMRRQIEALSSLGLLSRFVGMLTDSRSFISYPRHEYFRRILCSVLGDDLHSGRLPKSEMEFIGKMVEDISYYNSKNYFGF